MHFVASVARHVGSVVLTARPQCAFEILAVARLANLASLIGGRGRNFANDFTKADIGFGQFVNPGGFMCVIFTWAMAANAIWRPLVGHESVWGTTHVGQILAIVTSDTKC